MPDAIPLSHGLRCESPFQGISQSFRPPRLDIPVLAGSLLDPLFQLLKRSLWIAVKKNRRRIGGKSAFPCIVLVDVDFQELKARRNDSVRFCVAGTYKKERLEAGKKYFSVASGGGTGRTLHPDNMAAGPASYGMTDTMGRMHSDAQFAGSSSVPAHVEMMGLIGAGNNPMVGMTVSTAVSIEEAAKAGKF